MHFVFLSRDKKARARDRDEAGTGSLSGDFFAEWNGCVCVVSEMLVAGFLI